MPSILSHAQRLPKQYDCKLWRETFRTLVYLAEVSRSGATLLITSKFKNNQTDTASLIPHINLEHPTNPNAYKLRASNCSKVERRNVSDHNLILWIWSYISPHSWMHMTSDEFITQKVLLNETRTKIKRHKLPQSRCLEEEQDPGLSCTLNVDVLINRFTSKVRKRRANICLRCEATGQQKTLRAWSGTTAATRGSQSVCKDRPRDA